MSSIRDYAWRRWWLSEEEVVHYGIDEPEVCRDFLSFKAWSEVVRKNLTEPGWGSVLDNKWWFALCYESFRLLQPVTYGLLHPVSGMFSSGESFRDAGDLASWLRASDITEFVLKPVYGWASTGVLVVRGVSHGSRDPEFFMQNGEIRSLRGLWEGLRLEFRGVPGYVLQERVPDHPALEVIGVDHPYSIRVVTAVDSGGQPDILMAVLYLGRRGDMVNKWDAGALSIYVDPVTGELGRGRTLPRFGTEWHSSHPDTGATFEGFSLPEWSSILETCLEAARLSPGCRVVCWEVLVAESGPRLIEGNLGFGLTMFQVHTDGLLRPGAFRAILEERGAELPNGTHRWVKRHSRSRMRRSAAQIARRARFRL